MKGFGWINRSGPSGWDIRLQGDEESVGILDAADPLFEALRQSYELLVSGEDGGHIAGSDERLPVRTDEFGRRRLALIFTGVRYHLRWMPSEGDIVRFMVVTPFQFPRDEDPEDQG